MIHFFRLIRWKNILIIAFTMFVMRYCIIQPFLANYKFQLQFDFLHFVLLVLSTLLIAAAGYIINDYYDTTIDTINRPDKVIIDKFISKKIALTLSILFNLLAIIIAIYLSYFINIPRLGILFVLITGLLWFYSESYKSQFLVGNIIISLLTATIPLIVYLFEIPPVNAEYKKTIIEYGFSLKEIRSWIIFYVAFAFITTLIREIIKDAEDFEGDNLSGRNTIPLTLGIQKTRYIVASLTIILILLLSYVYLNFMKDPLSLVYMLGLIIAPLVLMLIKMFRATTKDDYHFLSNLCKWIMLTGISYGFLARFLIYQMNA